MEDCMKNIVQLFRKRIGYPDLKKITFEDLSDVLVKTGKTFPFENLCIMKGTYAPITQESLIVKTLVRNEGGLCYELNPVLYLFLKENGFHVCLVDGVVFNQAKGAWSSTGRTHVAILLEHENQKYIIDTGFGANIPLAPIPLSGEIVKTGNGEFRISKSNNEFGDFVFEMKRRDKDTEWQIGYTFGSKKEIRELSELDNIQTIIRESKDSSFNKSPLITILHEKGSMTLTNHSFTKWEEGKIIKEDIDEEKFKELAKKHFGLQY